MRTPALERERENSMNHEKTMRAVVMTAPGAFGLETIPRPNPTDNEVLCRIRAVAICGSDPEIFSGKLAGHWPPAYPFVAGHEWAGEIVAVGKNVTGLAVGDRVAGEAHCGCGHCQNCMEGRYNLCLNYGNFASGHRHYGFITPGAYAQYQVYDPKAVTKMPENLTFAEGSMNDTLGVALHGVELVGIRPGGTVVIIGPGPIGLCAMRVARAKGAGRILMVGRGARLAAAGQFGADGLIDIQKQDPVEAVRALTGGLGADTVLECSGAPGTLVQAVSMTRRGGRVSLIGVAKDEVREEVPFKYLAYNEIMVIGSKANPNASRAALELMSSRQADVRPFITHRFLLEDFAEALDTFVKRKGDAIKVVIYPNGYEEALER